MTHEELTQQLERGIAMARDPRNAQASGPDAVLVTTIYSPWLLKVCQICRHTFREQDTVRPDPDRPGRMRHFDVPTSRFCTHGGCASAAEPAAESAAHEAIRTAFLRGLQLHWTPAGGMSTELVGARSPLVGRKCPICRHTVRPGDTVVRCPCGRDCGGVFHQDPLQHMTCWDTWNRGQTPSHCAFTGAAFLRPLEEPS